MLLPIHTAFRLLVVSFAVAALVACGGKSDDKGSKDTSSGTSAPTQDQAIVLAHRALIEPADLSGDWLLYTTDNFRNDDSSLLDNGNCASARKLAGDMSRANISRAQRAIQQVLPGHSSRAQVEVQIRIFDKEKTAKDFLARSRAIQTSDTYIRCLADGFNAQFGSSNAQVRTGEPHGKAPNDGIAVAYDQNLRVDNALYELYTDSYSWVEQNVYVLVLISGPRALDSNDFVKLALERMQVKVDSALKGTSTTAPTPSPTAPPPTATATP